MTYDSTTTGDHQIQSSVSGGKKGGDGASRVESQHLSCNLPENQTNPIDSHHEMSKTIDAVYNNNSPSSASSSPPQPTSSSASSQGIQDANSNLGSNHHSAEVNSVPNENGCNDAICYNKVLDDEIRARLDKLNALSDLINSLERQFDEANSVFRETLKCSTDRLSSISKALGNKSIRHGRVYHAAKLSVEESQSDCQKACVQFERANIDHQFAKKAIREAELKLREAAGEKANGVIAIPNICIESIGIDICKLKLDGENIAVHRVDDLTHHREEQLCSSCDKEVDSSSKSDQTSTAATSNNGPGNTSTANTSNNLEILTAQVSDITQSNEQSELNQETSSASSIIRTAADLSEELNQAILKLVEAEKKRGESERQHLDRANKLMVAQEYLMKLEREYGPSIRRSQLYFDESKRFKARLDSVKGEILRISEGIIAAKQAYAQTLKELEQFSDELHDNSGVLVDRDQSREKV